MEQTTFRVNWRPVNSAKVPGEMRRGSYQALARGAAGILFFQWRASAAGHGEVPQRDARPRRDRHPGLAGGDRAGRGAPAAGRADHGPGGGRLRDPVLLAELVGRGADRPAVGRAAHAGAGPLDVPAAVRGRGDRGFRRSRRGPVGVPGGAGPEPVPAHRGRGGQPAPVRGERRHGGDLVLVRDRGRARPCPPGPLRRPAARADRRRRGGRGARCSPDQTVEVAWADGRRSAGPLSSGTRSFGTVVWNTVAGPHRGDRRRGAGPLRRRPLGGLPGRARASSVGAGRAIYVGHAPGRRRAGRPARPGCSASLGRQRTRARPASSGWCGDGRGRATSS